MKPKKQSGNELKFIRQFIKLAHTYENDKEVFYDKCVKLVQMESLKKHHVIDNSCSELSEEVFKIMDEKKLTKREKDFYLLSLLGFEPCELTVILGYKRMESVYVQQSRINGKLRGSALPEVLVVMAIMGIFVMFLMIFCYEIGVMGHIDKFFEKLNFDPWINEMIKSLPLAK